MGRIVTAMIADAPDLELAGGIARAQSTRAVGATELRIERPDTAAGMLGDTDVVVDFSSPDALGALLRTHADVLAGRALVVGTTGFGAEIEELLERCARGSAVVVAANFSIGVNLLLGLVARAAAVLGPDAYDVEIVETHHGQKADAPSGTALALGRSVAQARGAEFDAVRRDGRSGRTGERPAGEIGLHALRGGTVAGEHRVHFLGRRERLELAHAAADRSLFAEGALRAVRWAAARPPGRYTMAQVLGI
jgi:4-hydroxy-tetrahydrodipicolinate reductase